MQETYQTQVVNFFPLLWYVLQYFNRGGITTKTDSKQIIRIWGQMWHFRKTLCKKRIRHKLSISSLYSDPCCSVMIASLRDFFFLLRSSTHLMSTKFKEQMIMTTLHHHQTYYTTFKASWVNSILEFWAVSLFVPSFHPGVIHNDPWDWVRLLLEPVRCKKRQKKFMTSYFRGSEWYKIDLKWLMLI